MITDELKKELLKIPIEELVKIYEVEKARRKRDAEKRYTLGRLDVMIATSATNKSNEVIEYILTVPEGVLCYVKAHGRPLSQTVEKMLSEINELINKYQR